MSITIDNLFNSLSRLDHWRHQSNGNDIGFGFDFHKPKERFHYPDAYAIFGNGYLKLFNYSKNTEYLDNAHYCYEWLIKHSSPRYQNLSWGLPWSWNYWHAPPTLSYVCTTMFVANFFINYYLTTNKKNALTSLLSIYDWLLHENGYRNTNNGISFYYANFEPLKFIIFNHNALALEFLVGLWPLFKKDQIKDYAQSVLNFLVTSQHNNGSWYYSEKSCLIDNFHSSLTLLGVAKALKLFTNKTAAQNLHRGFLYYKSNLFTHSGKPRECVNVCPQIRVSICFARQFYAYLHSKASPPPARLWSYGAAIRLFCFFNDKHFAQKVALFAINKMQSNDGSFYYREHDPSKFIRHEAHIFDALATLLNYQQPISSYTLENLRSIIA